MFQERGLLKFPGISPGHITRAITKSSGKSPQLEVKANEKRVRQVIHKKI